ncbi:hypothetical protein FKN08_24380 [Vibrio sp. 1-2 (7-a)]|uniref:hypothetical protein n=1 Tax=Vibrio sp. 1-2 (7-a) TaxID=2591010 RepID=UPI001481F377|nr:hypothetical protein [Vibrio sp. 1-2 (7-a)]NNN59236.1 hypothetical protein [Vibrio sp. 1-2 (7-a)]
MTDMYSVLGQILDVDGHIRIRPYNPLVEEGLKSAVLWKTKKTSGVHTSHYGDDFWTAPGEKQNITFHNTFGELGHELRALALGMLKHGAGEGMTPLKWNTTHRIIRSSKRFGIWLKEQNIMSLSSLDSLPLLRLRNLLENFLLKNEAIKHVHVAQEISSCLYWWRQYGIVISEKHVDVLTEILAPYIAKKSDYRQKHAVIPTRVMKILLKECEFKLIQAEKFFNQWEAIQNEMNRRIPHLSRGHFNRTTHIDALSNEEANLLNELHPYFSSIKRYVFVLVIAYSGMRHSEVLALEDDAAFSLEGKYYIKSLLSKTSDGSQKLEWVVSELAFRGIQLLSKMNNIYRERAKILLKFYGDKLPEQRAENMKFGCSDNKLFQVRYYKQAAQFSHLGKQNINCFSNINQLINIPLEQSDIDQLEKLGCNVHSVSASSVHFRKPYQVGMPFNFTSHQFRHTFAWFIVANRLGDLDDIKYQYKHMESSMSLVYSHRGYDSLEELMSLTHSFEEYLTQQAMTDMVAAAEQGHLAGRGGEKFIGRLNNLLGDTFTSGSSPHFSNMQELLTYTAKHSASFRGLSHGYCTKGSDCQIRNAADPSHCVNCDSYIATPKHLPHWKVIKKKCEYQLARFEQFPEDLKPRFASFKGALLDNLYAANSIINQLQISIKEG